MPIYPTYTINGVPLQDMQGRWHEAPDTPVFPSHPGLRGKSLELAGVDGLLPTVSAPLEVAPLVLPVIFNARRAGRWATTIPERLLYLRQNMQDFLAAMRIGQQTQGGYVDLELHLSLLESVTARARMVASSESEYEPGADYLRLELVFEIHRGKWHAPWRIEELGLTGTQRLPTPGATAAIEDVSLSLVGPIATLAVTNQMGQGFFVNLDLPAGEHMALDSKSWATTSQVTSDGPLFTGSFRPNPRLERLGSASSYALTLLPDPSGAQVGVTTTGTSSNTAIHIRYREAFI